VTYSCGSRPPLLVITMIDDAWEYVPRPRDRSVQGSVASLLKHIKKVRCSQVLHIFGHRAFFETTMVRQPSDLSDGSPSLMLVDTKHLGAGRGECLRCKPQRWLFSYHLPTSATFPRVVISNAESEAGSCGEVIYLGDIVALEYSLTFLFFSFLGSFAQAGGHHSPLFPRS
jgi:hypothetical protein